MPSDAPVRPWLEAQTWPDLRDRIVSPQVSVYRHPYGFVVCRLEEKSFPEYQIRVHLWPDASEYAEALHRAGTAEYQVHCHGWHLESSVVIGALVEASYSISPDAAGSSRLFRVESDYAVGTSRLLPQRQRVRVERSSLTRRDVDGAVFAIPPGMYHSTAPEHGPAVTVAATQTRPHGSESYVVGPAARSEALFHARSGVSDLAGQLARYDRYYDNSTMRDDRWAAFVFVIDEGGHVLMVRSARRPELWQPVGGRAAAEDADPLTTAIREAAEEVGISIAPDELVLLETAERDLGSGRIYFWVLRLDRRPQLTPARPEIAEVAWLGLDELKDLDTYPGTRRVLATLERSEVAR